jgi:aspartyl-tRNA(Asn)/glutamyl-tRNA(Gln) amidotransferase subunit A
MAAFPEDLFFATVSELGTRLRAREFSAAELVRAFSDRIEKLGPRYNALALSLRADAIKQAKAADDRFRHRPRGPLEGIPYGVKDLLAVSDRPTTWGALPLAGQTFPDDAAVIHSLDKAGAALIAKLALVELAGAGGYRSAAASMFGPGLNPWDRTRWAGGSSSGSAAAVAAGLVPFALGSETWGSIGVPCAYCGVTGLRPTYGLVSRQGAMPVAWTMDKIGPIGRSAEDCGLVLHAISGGDTGDPGSAGKRFYYWAPYAPDPKQLRIGFAPADYSDWAEAAARPAFEAALDAIRATGVQMREVALPDFPYGAIAEVVIAAESSAAFEPFIASGAVEGLADPVQIAGLRAGLEITAADYLKAMRARREIQHALGRLFIDYDLLVSPTCYGPATAIGEPVDGASGPKPGRPGLSELGAAGNLAGLPALFLPCGFAGGLPVGIQLVARPFQEALLIAYGREFQQRTDWHRRRPPA